MLSTSMREKNNHTARAAQCPTLSGSVGCGGVRTTALVCKGRLQQPVWPSGTSGRFWSLSCPPDPLGRALDCPLQLPCDCHHPMTTGIQSTMGNGQSQPCPESPCGSIGNGRLVRVLSLDGQFEDFVLEGRILVSLKKFQIR